MAIDALKAQSDGDTISRKQAIDALDKIFPADPMRNDYTQGITCGAALATEYIKQLPSAQPEQTNSWCINSWCIDCKEYDTENKCCPRYNRVIKQTLDEVYAHAETEAEDCEYFKEDKWRDD